MDLTGKTAVVTGAGRGIGAAYAARLATDGAHVVVVDIHDSTDLVATLGGAGEKLGVVCDVSDRAQILAVTDRVEERFGRADILVNNAAIFPPSDLDSIDLDVWRRVQATNVESTLQFTQAFAGGMREAGWGRVVNTGSANTLLQGHDLAYIVSKGAVHALTRALANELGHFGITVNAIAPSVVATEGFSGRNRETGPTAEQIFQRVSSMQTLERPSTVDDLAGALAWLVSDDASFVTGQIIHVDGGLTRSGA